MTEKTMTESRVPATAEKDQLATREPTRYLTPAVDIYETENSLVVVADMPGVGKDDLSILVEEGILTIQGKTDLTHREDAKSEEYSLYHYFRQFRLSEEVDRDRISAELKHGVLTLQLPKAEKAKPKRIDVKVS